MTEFHDVFFGGSKVSNYEAIANNALHPVNETHYTHYYVNPLTGETGSEDVTKDIKSEQRRQVGIRGAGGAVIGGGLGAGVAKLKRISYRSNMKKEFDRHYHRPGEKEKFARQMKEHQKGDLKAMGKGALIGGTIVGGANIVHYNKHKDDVFDGTHNYDQVLTQRYMESGDAEHLHAVRANPSYSTSYKVDRKK